MSLHNQTHQVFGAMLGSSARTAQILGQSFANGSITSGYATGPERGARYAYQYIASGTFAATLTVWYSLLPNPDPAVDADWFQDTSIGTVALAAGTSGNNIGNATCDWIRYKVNVTSGTLVMSLWHRADRAI